MLTTKDTKIFTKDTKRTCLCLPVACLLQAGQTGITENEIAHKVTGLAIIKSVEALNDVRLAQTLTCIKLGLPVNFNVASLKDGIRRVINGTL